MKKYTPADVEDKDFERLKDFILSHAGRFADDFTVYSKRFEAGGIERLDDERKTDAIDWLKGVLQSPFVHSRSLELTDMTQTYYKRGIKIQLIVEAINFVRRYFMNTIDKEVEDPAEVNRFNNLLNSSLDLSTDMMMEIYQENESETALITERAESVLIRFAERFTYLLNIILVLALIGISIGVISLFFREVYDSLTGGLNTGILSALGTLLIIWVMVELMGTEIKYLKGQSFHIEVFISVALVAFIREFLIASLGTAEYTKIAVSLAGVLVLGFVYYLISKAQS